MICQFFDSQRLIRMTKSTLSLLLTLRLYEKALADLYPPELR